MSDFLETTLNNGLRVIIEPNRRASSVAVGFFVRTGATNEQPFESGLSHFLEHMLFKGTKSYDALGLSRRMSDLGAMANAYTSEEITCYYGALMPEYLNDYFDILCEMVSVPTLDEDEFNMERNVILEEISLYEDRPLFKLISDSYKVYFGDHPAGSPVLGTVDSIKEMKLEWMREYFSRRYAPNNMVLVVTGACDPEAFVEYANKQCGAWKRNSDADVKPYDKGFAPICGESVSFTKDPLKQHHILLLSNGPTTQDAAAWSVLMQVLGSSVGSKIYWDLIHTGLSDYATICNDDRSYLGCTYTYASTNAANYEIVLQKLRDLQNREFFGNFSEQDLNNAKTKYATSIVKGGETPMSRLMAIGPDALCVNRLRSLKDHVAEVMAVTKDNVIDAINKYKPEIHREFQLLPAK